MDNAVKALLIAATVLVAMVMVSIEVYLYSLYSHQSKEYSATISAVELEKFNSNFDVYIGRDNIKPQEIVTIVNLAKEYGGQIEIYLGGSKIEFTASKTQEDFIKSNRDKLFKCTLNTSAENPNPTYDENGKIVKLKFN